MYSVYLYDLNGQPVVVTVTNLPAGQYDVLIYGADGNYEIAAGATSYGIKTSRENVITNPPVWIEGVQYARFQNVVITAGQPMVLTVRHGLDGYAQLAGMQIMESPLRAPTITSQPTSQSVFIGGSTTFSVSASGTAPLTYQWNLNSTNIVGATNTTLNLTNVQLSDGGNYAVVVSNTTSSVASSNASLTVSVRACTNAPSGLTGWWQAEGNAQDAAGGNIGTLHSVNFVSGKVGQVT